MRKLRLYNFEDKYTQAALRYAHDYRTLMGTRTVKIAILRIAVAGRPLRPELLALQRWGEALGLRRHP